MSAGRTVRGVTRAAGAAGEPDPITATTPVLEIGGTHVTAALVDTVSGRILDAGRRTDPLDGGASAEEIVERISRCAAALDPGPGAHWGVALPGPFDYGRGIAEYTGVGKFDALHGLDLGEALLARLPAAPSRISFLNDAHAFTLGEWAFGAAAGHTRVVGITLGTGIGGAFLDDGRAVCDGPDVPPEGVVHLLTHAGRPIEDTVSRRAVLRAYASTDPDLDVREIAALARSGEPRARDVLDTAFGTLGRVLGPWLTRFRASVVVVGGSMAGSWDLLADPILAGLRDGGADPRVPVRPARDLRDAALLGTGWHTRSERCPRPVPADRS